MQYPYISFLFILLFLVLRSASSDVVLNELVMSNGDVLGDNSFDPDFNEIIEIYNAGSDTVNLDGYGLTNDPALPLKWTFPAVKLADGDRLFVKASAKDMGELYHYERDTFYLHTNFRLSATGDFVGLAKPDGQWADSVTTDYVPRNMSYGRFPDGTGAWYHFPQPSINQPNSGPAYPERTEELVHFTEEGGHYSSQVSVSMYSDPAGGDIYYTLDGSTPDTSDYLYDDPVIIDETTVLRARVIEDDALAGEINSSTYFINEDVYLPVVSIVTDPDNLWDDDIGIYVNYDERGGAWERESNFEYFDKEGEPAVNMPIGLRIHGGFTRQLFPQKSLRVYARGGLASFSSGSIDHNFFEHRDAGSFKRVILRQGGNDWNSTMFRDAMQQTLLRPPEIIKYREYNPVAVYLNGEYWGIHNMRDRDDKYFVARETGVDPDSVYMIANRRTPAYGDWDSRLEWLGIHSWVEDHDLSVDSNYEYISEIIDLDNFATFYTSNVYVNNHDWPGNNNIKYRTVNPEGKWRWINKDMDFGYALYQGSNAVSHDMLQTAIHGNYWANYDWSRRFIQNFLDHDDFKHMFINRFADHLNTWYLPESVQQHIDSLKANISDEIPNHIDRWGSHSGQFDDLRSIPEWEDNIQRMRDFADGRPSYMRQHIRNYFNISDVHELTLDVKSDHDSVEVGPEVYGGWIRLNDHMTINDDLFTPGDNLYPWEGKYFDDIPVQLEAIADEGYTFSHWEGDVQSSDSVIEVVPHSDMQITAVFDQDIDKLIPEAHHMSEGEYFFYYWSDESAPGTYPDNMVFEETYEQDPDLNTEMQGYWELAYDKNNRSRINGLGNDGFSFINTSNPNEGGGYLGSAILALNTTGQDSIHVKWKGGTVKPNSRKYAIRLQYRLGHTGPFYDLKDGSGEPVEYVRNDNKGHTESFGPYILPEEIQEKEYVQLRWKYYYINTGVSGPRAKLNINEVRVLLPDSVDPPEQPVLFHPDDDAHVATRYPEFRWFEPEDASAYELQIAEDTVFSPPEQEQTVFDTVYEFSDPLDHSATYYWRVRGVNSGGYGDWSDTWSFQTPELDVPSSVNLSVPEDSAEFVDVPVTFKWYAIADTPAVYNLQVSVNEDLEDPLSFDIENDTTKSLALSGEQTYYWRVRAENNKGAGPWSEIQNFKTTPQQVPGQVTLISPEDDEVIDEQPVELTWSELSEAEDYQVFVSLDESFSNLYGQYQVTDTILHLDGLDQENTYWWRVHARNSAGSGPISSARSFSFLNTALSKREHSQDIDLFISPNPANDRTDITFNMPASGNLKLKAYSVTGQKIEKLIDKHKPSGPFALTWNTADLESGVYIIKLKSDKGVNRTKSVIVR